MRVASVFAVLALSIPAADDLPFERGLDLIRNELRLAQTGLRAMAIAAHPDDEDGGTLSYLRRTLGVETHMCLATRGEGGQNEAGPELGAALAVIRSNETERAAKILGAKVWYLNLPDFGYSKTTEETLKVWGREKALEQLVRVIRIVRPHILFMNHDPNGTDHGHHRATGLLAVEAFDAAADPAKFAASMKEDGTAPWKPSKLYLRRFAPPGATLIFDISTRDPLTGLSAPEIAAHALAEHKSQGMQRDVHVGDREMRYFTVLKSHVETKDEKSMTDGLSPTADQTGAISAALTAVLQSPAAIEKAIPQIAAAAAQKSIAPEVHEHVCAALREALGIRTQVEVSDGRITYGEAVTCKLRIANGSGLSLKLASASLRGESSAWKTSGGELKPEDSALDPRGFVEWSGTAEAQPQAFPTFPADRVVFSRMQTRSPLRIEATLLLEKDLPEAVRIPLVVPVPVDLAPLHTAETVPEPVLLFDDPAHDDNFMVLARIRLALTNHRAVKEPLKLFGGIQPRGDEPVDKWATYTFRNEDETQSEEFRFLSPVTKLNAGDVEVPLAVWTAEKNFGGPKAILRRVPIKLPPTLNVALVKTYDSATHEALKRLEETGLGLTLTLLSADDLRTSDLNRFHTIVLDIRATQYRPELRGVKERLKQFMTDGGNIVCMYHKDFDWNEADGDQSLRGKNFFRGESGGGEIAPYPIELSFNRVTDENAAVEILKPEHPLLNEPCKIFERDFSGWVQERGVYFPKTWAPEYTALLRTKDPNEPALDGGLLVADVGRGSFIYTSFVWYRQLRAGVPGAYRMLANLISYPRVKRKE
ncbi:MAG TPA: PIG-L family deacetylase [Planctomycetota bacterium]|nr:PIG-L family deacetylase [Planctomycetota bacterium]